MPVPMHRHHAIAVPVAEIEMQTPLAPTAESRSSILDASAGIWTIWAWQPMGRRRVGVAEECFAA